VVDGHVRMRLEGKRYSPFDPDEVHADMRADPDVTWRNLRTSAAAFDVHRDCPVCAQLRTAGQPSTLRHRRAKVVLTPGQVHELLGLRANLRVVYLYVVADPHLLCVVVEGDDLDAVGEQRQTPVLRPKP
jgi:hypothetical protein